MSRRNGVVRRNRRYAKTGVPRGYSHDWHYDGRWKEKKLSPGKWKGSFKAIKTRKSPAKYHKNAPGKGSVVKWEIHGTQTATKLNKNKYATDFKFTKKLKDMKHRR